MVIEVGKITGRRIGKNRDGSGDVILLQVEVSDSDDIRTVELHRGAGVDLNPPDGSLVGIVRAGNAWQVAATLNDNITPDDLDEGTYQIYASDAGAKTAKVNLDPGGDVAINNGTDFAVQYTALKSAFDTLVTDFNNLVTTFNGHVHPGVTAGPGSTAITATPGTSSTADMTSSKIDTVKVP